MNTNPYQVKANRLLILFPFSLQVFSYYSARPDEQLVRSIQKAMFDVTEEMYDLMNKSMPCKFAYIFFLSAFRAKLACNFCAAV